MNVTKQSMRGARVEDVQCMLGKGTVIWSDVHGAMVRWDSDNIDTFTSWNDLELIEEES